jgi:DNA-binding CsgD family transcriptional regulator
VIYVQADKPQERVVFMGRESLGNKSTEAVISHNVVNFRWVKKQNLPYIFIWIIYYAWVIVFATWWTASPLTADMFDDRLRSLMHAMNLISSAVFVFIFKKDWFVKTARIGAVLVVVGMILFMTVQDAQLQIAAAFIIAISVGCVNTSILMPFVFALNNTEKLYAVIGSNALISLLMLFLDQYTDKLLQSNSELWLSFGIVVVALSATLLFNKTCLLETAPAKSFDKPKMHFSAYWMLILSCMFAILGKGVGKGILNIAAIGSSLPLLSLYQIGSLAGCGIYFLIFAFSKKSIYLTWNIAFGTLAMGFLLNGFSSQAAGLTAAFALLFGISNTMGMANMYYLLGVIGKKYDSLRYVRLSILFIGLSGVSGVLIGNFITNVHSSSISLIASVGAAVVVLIFLTLSPLLASSHYENEWAKDSAKMEIDNEQLHHFRRYRMSNREIEVCKLLLQGYTMRQISGILSIAYPTVNTYCTSIYRKTNVNSRTELSQVFKEYTNSIQNQSENM